MYRFELSVEIGAPPARVWRALSDPAEVVLWDAGVTEAIDAPASYPQPGQHVRWRYRGGPLRILHDRPQAVVPERTLRSMLRLGPYRFDETYRLESTKSGCRLTAAVGVSLPVPLLGLLLERAYIGRTARVWMIASLASIKRHCETSV